MHVHSVSCGIESKYPSKMSEDQQVCTNPLHRAKGIYEDGVCLYPDLNGRRACTEVEWTTVRYERPRVQVVSNEYSWQHLVRGDHRKALRNRRTPRTSAGRWERNCRRARLVAWQLYAHSQRELPAMHIGEINERWHCQVRQTLIYNGRSVIDNRVKGSWLRTQSGRQYVSASKAWFWNSLAASVCHLEARRAILHDRKTRLLMSTARQTQDQGTYHSEHRAYIVDERD